MTYAAGEQILAGQRLKEAVLQMVSNLAKILAVNVQRLVVTHDVAEDGAGAAVG